MHSTVFSGVEMCIKRDLLAPIASRLGSLDARVSDSGPAWVVRSTDRLPSWTAGSFSLLLGVGLNICDKERFEM